MTIVGIYGSWSVSPFHKALIFSVLLLALSYTIIENRGRPDPTFHHMDELEFIGLVSYDTFPTDRFLYDAYEGIMEKWCGFSPSWYWGEPLDDLPEVQDMPSYPEDGSIQIIHDVLVVKMQ